MTKMKNNIKAFLAIATLLIFYSSCQKNSYTLGDLTAPTNLSITTAIVGQSTANPNGDGSGDVKITITAVNALSYKVNYDALTGTVFDYVPTESITHRFTTLGTNTYRISAIAYGKGGTASTITKDITVRFDYTPAAAIVTNLTGGTSKTWVVDKSVSGHMGVGPWSGSSTPEWWAAGVNEKVACCNCFYTATFKFTKATGNAYTLQVTTPDGAFTKTGALAGGLPGIPGSGDEGCYSYGGGTSSFIFLPATSGIAASASTQTVISLAGNNTYIGYGAVQKDYEILSLTATAMYLRVRGTETGNAWYLKLKSI
jgi:hypothetical protein